VSSRKRRGSAGPACFGYGGRERRSRMRIFCSASSTPNHTSEAHLRSMRTERQRQLMKTSRIRSRRPSDAALMQMEEAYVGKIAAPSFALRRRRLPNASFVAFGGAGPMSACKVGREGVSERSSYRAWRPYPVHLALDFRTIWHTPMMLRCRAPTNPRSEPAVGQLTQRARPRHVRGRIRTRECEDGGRNLADVRLSICISACVEGRRERIPRRFSLIAAVALSASEAKCASEV